MMEVKPDAEVVVKEEIDSEISYESKVKVEQETAESMEIEVKTEPETEVNVSSILTFYKFLHAKKEDDVTMVIEVKTEPEADVLSILDRYKNIEDNKVTIEKKLNILDRLGKLGGRSEGRKAMVDPFKELMEFVESDP